MGYLIFRVFNTIYYENEFQKAKKNSPASKVFSRAFNFSRTHHADVNLMSKLTDFQTFFGYFHVFQVVEHTADRFRMITFKNETLKKNPKISFLVNFANFSHNL
jgi:hypothetical protein